MKSKFFRPVVFLSVVIWKIAFNAFACGPDFPNNLLDAGDKAVLQPPVANFQRELERMKLISTQWRAVTLEAGQTFGDQSVATEMTDLAAALKRGKISREQAIVIMQSHLAERMKLNVFIVAQKQWENSASWVSDENGYHPVANTNPPPTLPNIAVTPGLPNEFALYFRGAITWQADQRWLSNETLDQLLRLPPAERHYKSTWAAFMLGKYHAELTNDWDDRAALNYFAQVRTLATNGFADSPGLAAASLGEAARIYLRRDDNLQAIELYLEQFAAGDASAVESLRIAAARALAETNGAAASLKKLALNPRSRRVVTAYLISRNPCREFDGASVPETKLFFGLATTWIEAVEAAGVKDVESASQFALAAYQAGQVEFAQRWINRAGGEPVAQWLQAKLFMRAGKISAAAVLLAKLSRKFPQELPGTDATRSFAENLSVSINDYYPERIAIGRQALGELGALRLARREYAEALDALLRSGYWMDAAYVAERVLTADELKSYVDRNWPATGIRSAIQPAENCENWFSPIDVRVRIRFLLARKLARSERYAEARSYFPAPWQSQLDAFRKKLNDSRDEKFPARQRAFTLLAASFQMRTNGMELFGTELQPDWFIEQGNFQWGVTWQDRATNHIGDHINVASDEEIGRAVRNGVEPESRWHYRELAWQLRSQAADLAWTAAQAMPDNEDDTARFLCIAGTWIKKLDPESADKFYKALVNRCRKTAIGAQADRMRWFPVLDENGNPKPWPPSKTNEVPSAHNDQTVMTNGVGTIYYSEPHAGTTYVVHSGDSLVSIAREAGVRLKAIFELNTNLDSKHIRIGQLIFIPKSEPATANSPP